MRCRFGVSTVPVLCVFSLVAMGWTHLTDWGLSLSKAAAMDAPAEVNPRTGPPTVIGQVLFRGEVPPPTLLEIDRDTDICGQVSKLQPVSVDPVTHGLGQAIVHVDVVMAERAAAPMDVAGDTSPVRNTHCAFHPRIDVAGSSSVAEFINDDPLMHNTHVTSGNRTMVNVALVAGGNSVRKPFKKPGLYLVKCNVHKFMSGYRYVFDDSFYAKTNEAGQFRITGLPPGIHTVTVWHETLGTIHKEVQVPTKGTVRVDLEFK